MIQAEITGSIKSIITHAAKEPGRYAISGVLVERKAGRVRLAATDGHRLASIEHEDHTPGAGDADFSITVPTDAIKTLAIKVREEWIKLEQVGDEAWQLACNGRIVPFTPLEGGFPPIDDVMPKETLRRGYPIVAANPLFVHEAAKLMYEVAKRSGFEHDVEQRRMVWRQPPTPGGTPIMATMEGDGIKVTTLVMQIELRDAERKKYDLKEAVAAATA